MDLLSIYILTYNSDKYLDQILCQIKSIGDDIIILDGGSTDGTKKIAMSHNVRFEFRPFDNFKDQRNYASTISKNDFVLAIDADEIPSDELINEIQALKQAGFKNDAYSIRRDTHVLGKNVVCHYPVTNPDYVIRLINKKVSYYPDLKPKLHSTPEGYKSISTINKGTLYHYTFETDKEFDTKLEIYSNIAAEEVVESGEKMISLKMFFFPFLVWFKWYILKGSWRDGIVGWKMGVFTFLLVFERYKKAYIIRREKKYSHS